MFSVHIICNYCCYGALSSVFMSDFLRILLLTRVRCCSSFLVLFSQDINKPGFVTRRVSKKYILRERLYPR